jgi:hypothetical protein
MRIFRQACILTAAFVGGVMFVVSYDGRSSRHAEAASCDCAPAEPPISEERIVQSEEVIELRPMSTYGTTVNCEFGKQVILGGGCAAETGQTPDLILVEAGPSNDGWRCTWTNPTASSVNVRAISRCLSLSQ